MNISRIQDLAKQLAVHLHAGKYAGKAYKKGSELFVDVALYSFVKGHGYRITRQQPFKYKAVSGRIDFRVCDGNGSNPVLVEFACRNSTTSPKLQGSQNRPELDKLSLTTLAAHGRAYLLLMDLAPQPCDKDALRDTYKVVSFTKYKAARRSITVVYVHAHKTFRFPWKT